MLYCFYHDHYFTSITSSFLRLITIIIPITPIMQEDYFRFFMKVISCKLHCKTSNARLLIEVILCLAY